MNELFILDSKKWKKYEIRYILLILLIILTYFPLLSTGFTTNDDTLISQNFVSSYLAAIGQGRVGFFVTIPLLKSPYVLDSQIYYDFLRFGSPIILLCALFYSIRHFYKCSALALLTLVYFLTFIQNGWEQNLLTSYPFAFNMQFVALLLSFIAYDTFLKNKKLVMGVCATGLYLIAIANELFILYGIIFVIIAALFESDKNKTENLYFKIKATITDLRPIIIVTLLYLLVYLTWRHYFPSTYGGNTPTYDGFSRTFNTIWSFSVSAMPGYKFFHHENQYRQLLFGHYLIEYDFKSLLREMRIEWLIKALVVSYSTVLILRDKTLSNLSPSAIVAGLFIALGCIFIPNILVGFTEVYREWVESGSTSFQYTYFSFVAVVLFLSFVSIGFIKIFESHTTLKFLVIVVIALLVGFFSFLTDFHNYYVTKDQQLSRIKWTVIDRFIKTPEFANLPDGALIYSPSLFAHRNIMLNHAGYWSDYIKSKSRKSIQVVETIGPEIDNIEHPIYYLKFCQEPHSDNQYLIFSTILDIKYLKEFGRVKTNVATIFSYSNNRKLLLLGLGMGESNMGNVWINGTKLSENGAAGFTQLIDLDDQRTDFPTIKLNSEKNIDIDNLIISYYTNEPALKTTSYDLGEGFYGWEQLRSQGKWSWSNSTGVLKLRNYNDHIVQVSVSAKLISLTDQVVLITHEKGSASVSLEPNKLADMQIVVALRPGETRIKLIAQKPAIFPGQGDNRKLAFSIRDIQIEQLDSK